MTPDCLKLALLIFLAGAVVLIIVITLASERVSYEGRRQRREAEELRRHVEKSQQNERT